MRGNRHHRRRFPEGRRMSADLRRGSISIGRPRRTACGCGGSVARARDSSPCSAARRPMRRGPRASARRSAGRAFDVGTAPPEPPAAAARKRTRSSWRWGKAPRRSRSGAGQAFRVIFLGSAPIAHGSLRHERILDRTTGGDRDDVAMTRSARRVGGKSHILIARIPSLCHTERQHSDFFDR